VCWCFCLCVCGIEEFEIVVERRSRGREVFVVVGERCGAMAGLT
jgi:hypothetical protein